METIKVFQNELQHIMYHNVRVNQTRNILFGATDPWDLSELIPVPILDPSIIYRCRFLYSRDPGEIEFIPYTTRGIRELYLVKDDRLDYSFKYSDRRSLEELKKNLPEPATSDILIIRNGYITDTSFSNVAFHDGHHWYTPSAPLLKGTMREFCIRNQLMSELDIKPADLHRFKKIRLINAMLGFSDGFDIPVENIRYAP